MRNYKLIFPSDCVASVDDREHRRALQYMKRVLGADIRTSITLDLTSRSDEQTGAGRERRNSSEC
jgi:nicotinamidase-related amidase